ncbi:MAG TPA: GNAT family N-acetyltransferase [Bryobacteraceae bacterium]|jgi:ribosomal protein S18 acetylase RimI-like enzyme|nr:GNAT family N-acetyltransferase [Bryobacteraceae bacterium]
MSASLQVRLPEVVELPNLAPGDLDALFHREIQVWEKRFHWDFRPSAELLRRFVQIRSLYGYALVADHEVVGYAYHVCEGRKGLIGDFYVRDDYATAANEMMLLGATVQGLMMVSGVRRIESQLMLLNTAAHQTLPFSHRLARYDRCFMDIRSDAMLPLKPQTPEIKATFFPWSERFSEEIAHLVSAAYRGHVDSEINDQYRTIPGARHFLMNIIRYPGCGTFAPQASMVAVDDHSGRVAAVCLASKVSNTSGHVTQLCTLPAVRGARLGYELLRQTMWRLVEAGCSTISLTVTSSNLGAIRLYESVGFRARSNFPALVWEGF